MFVKFISSLFLAVAATIVLGILSLPYYWATNLFDAGESYLGWFVVFGYTFILMFVAFWNIITWMNKGKQNNENTR